MRRLAPLVSLAPLAALLAGCEDPVRPAGVTPPATAHAATDPMSKFHPIPADLEQKVQRFQADLESRGYEVARGYWTLWGVEDCKYPLQAVGFCYGNNPTAPYATVVVPPWPDEFVDQRFHHAIGEAQRDMVFDYRMGPQEALVVLAELPPPARYFGIGTNVFTRRAALNTSDPIYPLFSSEPQLQDILFAASPDPSRRMMIASIGDAINNVVIDRKSSASWGQQRYFVTTPDAGTADAMTAALLRAGVPSADQVFTEHVSPSLVRLGLGPEADDMITYIRYALPVDSVAGDAWRATLPLAVLRVRPARDVGAARPFAIPPYDTKVANFDERTALSDDLNALVAAVQARWAPQSSRPELSFSAYLVLDLVGQHCLGYPDPTRGPMNCLGDTQDADYQISETMHIDPDSVVAVVGTLGTATRNATYVSLAVNRFPALVGVANLSDVDLQGSAADFAGALQHDAGLFYVYYIARDCTGLHPCLEISRQQVAVGESIKLLQRNYVNPGSLRGPDPRKLLNPVTLVFDGRHRPGAIATR